MAFRRLEVERRAKPALSALLNVLHITRFVNRHLVLLLFKVLIFEHKLKLDQVCFLARSHHDRLIIGGSRLLFLTSNAVCEVTELARETLAKVGHLRH